MKLINIAYTSLLLMLLTGCMSPSSVIPASVIHQDAHAGGSALAFNHGNTLLASGGWEGILRLWSLPNAQPVKSWKAHDDSINDIYFLDNGKQIITAGYEGVIKLWSVDGVEKRSVRTPHPIITMLVDEGSQRIFSGHTDGVVRVWSLGKFSKVASYTNHHSAIKALAFHSSTNRIASSSEDGDIFISSSDGKSHRLPDPPTDAHTLVFSNDGKILFGGGWFNLFRWGISDRTLTVLKTEHRGVIKKLDLDKSGKQLASISREFDDAVLFLDPETGKTIKTFQPHDLCGVVVNLSPNDQFMATTSDDASVRLYDLRK